MCIECIDIVKCESPLPSTPLPHLIKRMLLILLLKLLPVKFYQPPRKPGTPPGQYVICNVPQSSSRSLHVASFTATTELVYIMIRKIRLLSLIMTAKHAE